jgi:hypothetical protein
MERAKTTTAPSKEVNKMYGTDTRARAADEELIEVLTAISTVSKRLARKLTVLANQSQHKEGGKADEQNGRYGCNYRRTAQCRCRY